MVRFTLSGQSPASLDPVLAAPVNGQGDPVALLQKAVVEPLMQPLSQGGQARLVDDSGADWDLDALTSLVLSTQGEDVDADAEDSLRSFFQQAMRHYDPSPSLPASLVHVSQAAASLKPQLPAPGPLVIYTAATDVIPAAKALLASGDSRELLVGIAYAYSPETLGFWFQSEDAFDAAKAWMSSQYAAMAAAMPVPGATDKLMKEFLKTQLKGLTEGFVLRKDDADGQDELSFPRVVVSLLMQYMAIAAAQSPATAGVLPLHLGELVNPKTMILVNAEKHARAPARKVDNEWRLIKATLSSKVRMVSNKSLSKLTAMSKAVAKASAAAANAQTNRQQQLMRMGRVKLKSAPPTAVDVTKDVIRRLARMKEVNRSRNVFKKSRSSYLKASRRHPDDFNVPGKITSTHYLPDLHIYIDTSGSIDESNYRDAVIMLIKLAKRMNVDLYFNSFSHVLSQETLLRTAGKSVNRIWKEFQRVPKVEGGTQYKQIWDYIEMSPERKQRFSLIVTDFEWDPPSGKHDHPKNLYYAPCSNADWATMKYYAHRYARSMRHIDPAIGSRLLGMSA